MATPRTGRPRGRPKGAINKATKEKRAEIEASGLTPLDFMLGILRDEGKEAAERFEAAKAAAPYVHARLSSIEASGPGGGPIPTEIRRTIVDPRHTDS